MSELDVVAELDRWLDTEKRSAVPGDPRMMQRARDEIVALRALVEQPLQHTTAWAAEISAQARAEALEEAARECFQAFGNKPDDYAAAIRALKDRPG